MAKTRGLNFPVLDVVTRTITIDIWNYWHLAITAVLALMYVAWRRNRKETAR
jgi:galactitol-specific phosphotransferase system IIC component